MSFKLKEVNVTKWVKGWKLGSFFRKILTSDETVLKEASAKAVVFLDNLRGEFAKAGKDLSSATGDMIVSAIPMDWPQTLREAVVNVIVPKVINESLLVEDCLKQDTLEKKIDCLFNVVVPAKAEGVRTEFWTGIAARITHEIGLLLTGQPFDWTDVFAMVPMVFKQLFKN